MNKLCQYLVISQVMIYLLVSTVQAQVNITLLDDQFKEPVIGAHVKVTKEGGGTDIYISNQEGEIQIPNTQVPFSISIEHLGFATLQSEVTRLGAHQFTMVEEAIQMEHLIVTGQFEPQSIDEAVFSVKSIDVERIEAQGAVDLADVLSNNLNITLRPNSSGDRTEIEMLGLDGRHVKVLIDGVPLVGVSGNGNNADLTQINMGAIERIEIVEGPMSVNYGANATAGVINLITKKTSKTTIDADFSIQEETVGPEYGWNEGRHIQTLGLGYKLSEKLYTRIDYRHNDFNGLKGDLKGFDHTRNDSLRGFEWQPKEQYFGGFSMSFKGEKGFRARYSLDYMDQVIDLPSTIVFPDEHPQTRIERPFSFDERFQTKRISHGLQFDGRIKEKVSYNLVANYSKLDRDELLIRKRILTDVEEEVVDEEKSSYNSATTRGVLSYYLNERQLAFQAGIEHTYEDILSSGISGGTRNLNNLATFASVEWAITDQWKFRPGIRTVFNSIWSAPLIYSFHLKYKPTDQLDFRASYGRSYRTPNLTELYYYFVDANHDVQGNPNLLPEDGFGYALDATYQRDIAEVQFNSTLKGFFNNIKDQITLAVVNELPLQFQYTNVDQYKSVGLTLTNGVKYKSLAVNFGFTYVGRSNQLTANTTQSNEVLSGDFLFSSEYNLNATYNLLPLNLTMSVFYKHTGAKEQVRLGAEDQLEKGLIGSFDWLDLTVQWKAARNIQIGGGVKNALNLTNINSSAETGGTHAGAANQRGLAYGRSYFLKITYQLKQ